MGCCAQLARHPGCLRLAGATCWCPTLADKPCLRVEARSGRPHRADALLKPAERPETTPATADTCSMSLRQPALALVAALLLSVQAAAAAGLRPADPHVEVHNVLERFPTALLRWEDTLEAVTRSRGIKISYNASELRASGDWVSSSRPGGCPAPAASGVPLRCRTPSLGTSSQPLGPCPPKYHMHALPFSVPRRWSCLGRVCATRSPTTCWRCTHLPTPTSSTRRPSSLSTPATQRATFAAGPAACRCAWSTCAGGGLCLCGRMWHVQVWAVGWGDDGLWLVLQHLHS